MTHTTVFGPYNGPEQKNVETDLYSTINTLSVYAPVRRASVQVVDQAGAPVEGATVQFKVYNGAELFPLVTLKSDAGGRASIDTGRGDVMMWASLGDRYGYTKSTADDAEVKVVLDRTPGETYDETYTMMAPPEQPFNELPADVIAANAVRLAREDSIRNAYMATFAPPIYNRTEPQRWITQAQGNWREIEAFLHSAKPDAEFMNSLTAKDWREVSEATLDSFYPVNPRIGYEVIKPWLNTLRSTKTVSSSRLSASRGRASARPSARRS